MDELVIKHYFFSEWMKELKKEKPSIVKAIVRAFGFRFLLAAQIIFIVVRLDKVVHHRD